MARSRFALPAFPLALALLCFTAMVCAAQTAGLDKLKEGLKKERDKDRVDAIQKWKGEAAEAVKAAELLTTALSDNSKPVQIAAAAALIKIGDAAAVPVAQALQNQNADVRKLGFGVLAQLGPKGVKAAPLVAKMLVNQGDQAKQEAVRVLKLMGPGAAPAVLALLKDNEKTVQDTLRLMGPAATKEALPLVVNLTKDKDAAVRRGAASLLGGMGNEAKTALPNLAALMCDADDQVRSRAARSLTVFKADAVAPLLEQLKIAENHKHFAAVTELIFRIAPGQNMPTGMAGVLSKHLEHKDVPVRAAAIRAVLPYSQRAKELAEAVVPLLADKDAEVRNLAVSLLDPIHVAGVPALLKHLKNPSVEVRLASLSFLSSRFGFKTKEMQADLFPLLSDKDARIRKGCAELLRHAQSGDSLWPLAATLTDDDAEVRRTAGRSMRQLIHLPLPANSPFKDKGMAAANKALKYADPQDADVRIMATAILTKANVEIKSNPDPTPLPKNLANLKSDNLALRLNTINIIVRTGKAPAAAIPVLVEFGVLKSGNDNVRAAGLQALGKLLPESESAMIELARDKDVAVRRATIESLDRAGSEGKNVLNILFVGISDADPSVRGATARILARFGNTTPRVGSPGPDPAAVLALLKNDSPLTQISATYFVAALGRAAKEAIPLLAGRVKGDNLELRQASMIALVAVLPDSRQAVQGLLSDKDVSVRLATARALQRGTPDGDAVRDMLASVLTKDADAGVREAAAVSMTRFGAAAVPTLVKSASAGNLAAFQGLSKLKEISVPQLLELANHKEMPVRLAAIRVLGEFRFLPPAAVADIRKLREDPQREVRDAAVRVILRLQNLGVADMELLIDTLHDPSGENRRAAGRQLVNLRTAAVPRLLEVVEKSPDTVARSEAIYTLGLMGPFAAPTAVKPLIGLVRSDKAENLPLRIGALAALERMAPSADAGLLGILVDADPAAQAAVLDMLRIDQVKVAKELVIDMLRSKHPELRSASARALAKLGPEIAKDLEPLLADKEGDVRAAALQAMEKLTTVEVLGKFLRDDKQAVRDVAGQALAGRGAAAYGVLADALRAKDYRVQVAAANAIQPITDRADELLPGLIDVMLSAEGRDLEQQAAARAIERINPIGAARTMAEKASVPQLLDLLKKQPAEVRALACLALAEKGPAAAEALPALGELLKQNRTDVIVLAAAGRAVNAVSPPDKGQADAAAYRIAPDLPARLVKGTHERSMQLRDEIMTGLQQRFNPIGPNSAEVILAALQMGQNADDASHWLAYHVGNMAAMEDRAAPNFVRILALFHGGNKNFAVKLSPAAEQAVKEQFWRYLLDERGDRGSRIKPLPIAQINSVLPIDQFGVRVSAYLALDMLKDDPLYKDLSLQGRTLQDLHQEWTVWWREWARERARNGLWSEMGAPEYQLLIWPGLLNMFDCASDPIVKQRFKMLLDLTAVEEEQIAIQGTRSGRRTTAAAPGCALDQWKDVLQGERPRRLGEPAYGYSGIVWSSAYQLPPAAILLRKLNRPVPYYSIKNRHFFGGCVFGYATPHYVLGCQMVHDEGTMVGTHEFYGVLHRLVFDDMKAIYFPHHAGERWHVQHQSVYVTAWNSNNTVPQMIRISSDLKRDQQGEWLFVSNGPAYAAIYVEGGYVLEKGAAPDARDLARLTDAVVFKDARALVILQAGDEHKFGSFDKFQQAILKAPLVLTKESLRYTGPQSDAVEFFRDRTRPPVIAGPAAGKVKMTYDSPYLQAESGQAQVTVRVGPYVAVYDFDNNVIREEKK